MKKLNQKGFSHFEITLLVLVLAALGFAGYTVWQKNQPEPIQQSEQTKQKTNEPKVGVPEFSEHKSIGLSFKYPGSWVTKDDFKDPNQATDPSWDEASSFQGLNQNNTTSTQLRLVVKKAELTYEQSLAQAKNTQRTSEVTPLEVDGIKGYSKIVNYEGTGQYVRLFLNGKEYVFNGEAITMQQLLDIVKTVKRI